MSSLPNVLIVGGPDVDARIDLMDRLKDEFELGAVGSSELLGGAFELAGFDYHRYSLDRGTNPVSDVRTFFQLVALFRRLAPQVVHAFDTKPGVWGCIAARIARVPVVIGTVTGFGGSLRDGAGRKARLVWTLYRTLQRLSCRASDVTIFQNRADEIECVASGITTSEKATVIFGSGIATESFAPNRASADARNRVRDGLGIDRDAVVVTMISRVIRSKGVLELVEAARRTRTGHPSARFLLVGAEEPDKAGSGDALSAAELTALQEVVVWPGARKDVLDVLAASDVFALPSAYGEGIPRVLLEAGSMELPLVTTDSPGCADVVTQDVNGFLIPTHDASALTEALSKLIASKELRERFGKSARERVVREFDLSVVAESTRDTYKTLLRRKSVA